MVPEEVQISIEAPMVYSPDGESISTLGEERIHEILTELSMRQKAYAAAVEKLQGLGVAEV